MLRHQENLYKTINMIYHGKYTPYPMLSYGPYDCPLCPVKGLYHMMCNIILLVGGMMEADRTDRQIGSFNAQAQSPASPAEGRQLL